MKSSYADIRVQKKKKDFFQTASKNRVVKDMKKEYSLTLEEAALFTLIFSYMLDDGRSCNFAKIKNDFDLDDTTHLRYLTVLKKLKNKGLLAFEQAYKGRRENRLMPIVVIDAIIFDKLIFGTDIFENVNFSDIYSLTEAVDDLIDKKNESKLSESRFFDEFKRLSKRIDTKQKFAKLFVKYTQIEQLILFICIKEYFEGMVGEQASAIAGKLFETLSHKSLFLEKILKEEYAIFQDDLVTFDSYSEFFDTNVTVILTDKSISLLFDTHKRSNFIFQAKYTKHIPCNTLDKTLFLDKSVAKGLAQITNTAKPKQFKKTIKRLKKANLSSGLVSLFYGHPGTGKTASVYELAKKTKRDILQVDLSAIQSKWVGESEKNTREIFNEYRRAKIALKHKPILLFNEADGLLSKRLDISNPVGQMHNTMQNILLEELENFEGIFIATTNLINNLDDAFSRRFLHKLEFPKPGANVKKKIWSAKIPQLSDEIIENLSHYDLTGGQIENIAKRYMLETILNDKELSLHELKEYCETEVAFKREESGKRVGFCGG